MNFNRKFFIVIYSLTLVVFLFYLCFSDNNLKKHRELNREIKYVERKIVEKQKEIDKVYTKAALEKDSNLREQFIREELDLQKTNEDVFIIVTENNDEDSNS